jgi:Na+/proline symporter
LFLALAYFGTDQSQVQRYLAAKSEKESQKGLVFNGLLKIPMQFFILLTGVMVFVFYQFEKAPLFFNAAVSDKIETTDYVAAYQNVEEQYNTLTLEREDIYKGFLANPDEGKIAIKDLNNREKELRNEAKTIIQTALPDEESNDKDYVFISFILKYFPVGLVGLLLAVIFSAAMSSTASELNALASTTLMDIYLRNSKTERADYQNVRIGKLFTLMWGVIAIIFANICSLAENLIQFVNIIGSIFYGTVLGLFLIGFFIKYIQSNAVFLAGVITQLLVIAVFIGSYLGYFSLSYLWLNAGGCLFVILLAYIFQAIDNGRKVVVG